MKLQKVRYEDRLDVVLDVDPLALQALVPTFILQPLLENAIRHGIATRSTPGQIEIQAWCEGDALHLSVRDDGPGLAGELGPRAPGRRRPVEHARAAQAPLRRWPELRDRRRGRVRRPGGPAVSSPAGRTRRRPARARRHGPPDRASIAATIRGRSRFARMPQRA